MSGEGEELNTKHGAYGPLIVIHMKLELEAVSELLLSCMLSSLVRIVLRGPLLSEDVFWKDPNSDIGEITETRS